MTTTTDEPPRSRVRLEGPDGTAQFTGTLPDEVIEQVRRNGGYVEKNLRVYRYRYFGVDTTGRIHTFEEIPKPLNIAHLLKRT